MSQLNEKIKYLVADTTAFINAVPLQVRLNLDFIYLKLLYIFSFV